MTSASGQKINLENDDLSHHDQLYAEHDLAEIRADATGAIITMAGSAAVQALGNTNATGNDLANSVTARGVTVDLDAGSFTIDKAGVYRCYLSGRVEGEEDEDVTLEWRKNGTNLGEPAECLIEYDATGGVAALGQIVAHEFKAVFAKGDVITLGVLGSNDEVITFKRFNFGIEQVGSTAY